MTIPKEIKQQLIQDYKNHENDTGSTSIQCAILTYEITLLDKHLKMHKKDHQSRLGLTKMVVHRRKLLSYLHRTSKEAYLELIKRLGLRK